MRKILFKAKSVADNKWHYGYVYSIGDQYIMFKEKNTKNVIECYKNSLCQLIVDLLPEIELWEYDIIKISLLEDNQVIDEIQGIIKYNDFNMLILEHNGKEYTHIFNESYQKENKDNYKINIEKVGTIFD